MGHGLYLHPGFYLLALSWMPGADISHESLMRFGPDVEPPVVGVDTLAWIVNPPSTYLALFEDVSHRLEVDSVLLREL